MREIKLTVIPCPRDVVDAESANEGMRFAGTGDLKLLCGSCEAVVISGMNNDPNFSVKAIRCNKCGACNEVVREVTGRDALNSS